jgi:hypothetical protein
MPEWLQTVFCATVIGAGATVTIDLWAIIRKRLLGMASLNYAMVGRWLVHLTRGRFRHDPIAASPAVSGERIIGWIAHYLIGIAFAAALLAVWRRDWVCHPTLGPALMIGIASVSAPFFLMQPGMGLGIAANRTPKPAKTRMHSLMTHGIFGLGLYASAWLGHVAGLLQC